MEGENEAKDWLICTFVNTNMINVMTKYGAPMIYDHDNGETDLTT